MPTLAQAEVDPKADKIWADVELLLRTNNQKNYDQAVKWLRDVGDLATAASSDAELGKIASGCFAGNTLANPA